VVLRRAGIEPTGVAVEAVGSRRGRQLRYSHTPAPQSGLHRLEQRLADAAKPVVGMDVVEADLIGAADRADGGDFPPRSATNIRELELASIARTPSTVLLPVQRAMISGSS
jgi:hypothetical protein